MGLWWYFFAEIFDHFRGFFVFVFHAQSVLLLVPLTIRLQHSPLVLAIIACILMALFKVRLLSNAPLSSDVYLAAYAVVHLCKRHCLVHSLAPSGSP